MLVTPTQDPPIFSEGSPNGQEQPPQIPGTDENNQKRSAPQEMRKGNTSPSSSSSPSSSTSRLKKQQCQTLSVLLLLPNLQRRSFADLQAQAFIKSEIIAFLKEHIDVRYSVTYSPIHHDAGPNHFFSLAEEWWPEPAGTWIHMPGLPNPDASTVRCQRQLEAVGYSVHMLSIGAVYSINASLRSWCLAKMEDLLNPFFIHESTRMLPEVLYVRCVPGLQEEGSSYREGTGEFIIATRHLILVSHAMAMLKSRFPHLPFYKGMHDWFMKHVQFLLSSAQGKEARDTLKWRMWYLACLHSHSDYLDPGKGSSGVKAALNEVWQQYSTAIDLWEAYSTSEQSQFGSLVIEPLTILTALSAGRTCSCNSPRTTRTKPQPPAVTDSAECTTDVAEPKAHRPDEAHSARLEELSRLATEKFDEMKGMQGDGKDDREPWACLIGSCFVYGASKETRSKAKKEQ